MKNNYKGLSGEEVLASRARHGDNSLEKQKRKGFFGKFLENLSDPIIKILLIALAVQLVFTFGNCNFLEIGGIVAAIILSTTVSTASEYRSERAFCRLEENNGVTVNVCREGRVVSIRQEEIVVGDIIYLSAGEKIPCDALLLSGALSVDQSALNGESAEVRKIPEAPKSFDLSETGRIFRGSVITEGSAVVKCERVGTSTYYGMVARDVQTETRESPLKLKLSKLASQISRLGYIIAAVVGASFLFNTLVVDNGFNVNAILMTLKDARLLFSILVRTLTLMITVVVVAAPEGLPMMITVVLSANMKKMLADKILVKKLVGIETAGSMNILFTDKTGTITEGKPQIERIITANGSYKTLGSIKKQAEIYELLRLSARYNTEVTVISDKICGGNATERAIYSFFNEGGREETIVEKLPFTSDRKLSSVTFLSGLTLLKGAPELLLEKTERAIGDGGREITINRSEIKAEYLAAMKRGERVIAVVCRREGIECFVALIVMKDKIRKGVRASVRDVKGAGIQIVMLTGDSKETASAIAQEAGFFNPELGHIALDATELHSMNDSEVKSVIPSLRVLSRALPTDKTRIVRLSQELDLVVGMTGDGINDAPSLKLADVGFSMGSGTEVAKSASDIVILDNSFSAIDKTVLYGRTIFKSIRKFITFQLIMNLAASGISLIGQFVGIDTPITIIQMLWVNIIMDTLGGLAFAGEAPLSYYMKEKPKRRDEPLLTRETLNHIIFSGAYTLLLCTVFLVTDLFRGLYPVEGNFYTAFYALFIFSGIFNCFLARCERLNLFANISKNILFVCLMLIICVIQICMIYFGGEFFRCVPLSAKELSFVVLLAFTVIPFDIARRIVYKLK